MKVHTLDIDSSERDTSIYPHANNYVVTLKKPIYDISKNTYLIKSLKPNLLKIIEKFDLNLVTNKFLNVYNSVIKKEESY